MKLYQQLNEARTQGEWVAFEESTAGEYSILASPATLWDSSMSRWQANAQYTALAVNKFDYAVGLLEKVSKMDNSLFYPGLHEEIIEFIQSIS